MGGILTEDVSETKPASGYSGERTRVVFRVEFDESYHDKTGGHGAPSHLQNSCGVSTNHK